jgi:hypothetical protein
MARSILYYFFRAELRCSSAPINFYGRQEECVRSSCLISLALAYWCLLVARSRGCACVAVSLVFLYPPPRRGGSLQLPSPLLHSVDQFINQEQNQ